MLHIRGIAEQRPVRRLRIALQKLRRWLITGVRPTPNAYHWSESEQRLYGEHTQPLEIHSYPPMTERSKSIYTIV